LNHEKKDWYEMKPGLLFKFDKKLRKTEIFPLQHRNPPVNIQVDVSTSSSVKGTYKIGEASN